MEKGRGEERVMENVPGLYSLLLICVVWIVVMYAVSRIGGWSRLAVHYRETSPHEGRKIRFQSASMRWMTGYNNCLTFGPGRDGLHISALLPMRISHPSLMVPWAEISSTRYEGRFFKSCRLHFAGCPEVKFIVTTRLMAKIAKAMGGTSPIPEKRQD